METIVVGVDGSETAQEALEFALAEARLRKARLRVVHAYVLPLADVAPDPFLLEFPSIPGPELEALADDLRRSAESLIDDALEKALAGGAADLEIERLPVEGAPAGALVEASQGATLLVLGSRGHGRLRDLLLGSVTQQCLLHAPCPVAVVPARSRQERRARRN